MPSQPVRRTGNPKRRLYAGDRQALASVAQGARYTGSPLHKRNPGDFGLESRSQPRPDKTLCDGSGIFSQAEAQGLLEEGIRRGVVSEQWRNGWPQNVWAVIQGNVLEAALENQESGTYHGYPLQADDPMRARILDFWK